MSGIADLSDRIYLGDTTIHFREVLENEGTGHAYVAPCAVATINRSPFEGMRIVST